MTTDEREAAIQIAIDALKTTNPVTFCVAIRWQDGTFREVLYQRPEADAECKAAHVRIMLPWYRLVWAFLRGVPLRLCRRRLWF